MKVVSRAALIGAAVLVLAVPGVVKAQSGRFERLSVSSSGEQGDAGSYGPAISGDGSITAFVSNASNLVAGDANGRCDTFVRDTSSGETTRVSVTVAGEESRDLLTFRATEALAVLLGQDLTLFPSHHGGFLGGEHGYAGQPEAFAARLREVLTSA